MKFKYILSFLLLLILQLSFANSYAGIFANEGLCISSIEFSETVSPISTFSKEGFRENNIFEASFLDIASYQSVSFCGDYAELVESWKTVKFCGYDELAKLATNVDELDVVAKNADEIKAAGGYKAWKAAAKSNKLPVVRSAHGYGP